ncbi:MAG: M1 family metallopeptidase, partial [Phycisphaerales bacterium]|nr:M1 family metallopeptidase [Phycisphaerales bacterium]
MNQRERGRAAIGRGCMAMIAGMACVCVAFGAPRAGPPAWDEASGRSLLNWPTDRDFDHERMRLVIDIPDMGTRRFLGDMTLRASALGRTRTTMRLDAVGLTIGNIEVNGRRAAFRHEGGVLTIELPEPVPAGGEVGVRVRYEATFGEPTGNGVIWTERADVPEDDATPTDASPQIHTQGQAEWSRTWFPCHDFPNERLSVELAVTVAEGFEVVSNGALVSRESRGGGRVRWVWSQANPHPAYLTSLVIGDLQRVELERVGLDGEPVRTSVPMAAHGPVGRGEDMQRVLAHTPAMVDFFEGLFGAYPWEKYDQTFVREFAWGGMENTSATTLPESVLDADEGDEDDLIAHELMHQWFGDMVTCRSWAHLWLNEGWATYAEALWTEHTEGREAYDSAVLIWMNAVRAPNARLPDEPAVVSNRYSEPDSVFEKQADPYLRGGLLLHHLRMKMGDEAFFAGARAYLDAFRLREAETADFRRCMEDASGLSLERTFAQMLDRPALPSVEVNAAWDEGEKLLTFSLKQTQQIDARNPACLVEIPVDIHEAGGKVRTEVLRIDGREASTSVRLREEPERVEVDPRIEACGNVKVEMPEAWLEASVATGSTPAARIRAAEAIVRSNEASADTLARAMGVLATMDTRWGCETCACRSRTMAREAWAWRG